MKLKAPGWMQTADVVVHVQCIFFFDWTVSSEEEDGKVMENEGSRISNKDALTESNQNH